MLLNCKYRPPLRVRSFYQSARMPTTEVELPFQKANSWFGEKNLIRSGESRKHVIVNYRSNAR